ncbi:MAG: hypothetical protein HFE85_04995 [Clostridiales bacterium]|nr:hypothetical protein [Clostridiales bacterium]
MARYLNNIPSPIPPERIYELASSVLQAEGFQYVTYKGENVWKKGTGVLTAPQFIAITCHDGKVTIQAWIKYALLPGVYVGEMGLKGFFGIAIKEMLKARVNRLEQAIGTENVNYYNQAQAQNAPPQA